MKLTKRIKIRQAVKRNQIGLKRAWIPIGYIKNRPTLLSKFLGAGIMGRLDGFKFYD